MKYRILVFVLLSILIIQIKASAADKTIILICKYSHTIDAEGEVSETSGQDLVTSSTMKTAGKR